MIITKVFIAAAAGCMSADRPEIAEFFIRLNNCYAQKDLYFAPIFSTDLVEMGGTGGGIAGGENAESRIASGGAAISGGTGGGIAGGGLAFFIFGDELDSEVQAMHKSALDSYNKTGRPKISLYAKNAERGTYNAEFDNSYVAAYTHVDTLKLGILMQIKQLGLDGVDIRLDDGKAWQGGSVLLSLDNVGAVNGYENLQNLKRKREELESRYHAARARYLEAPEDPGAYEEFFEASKQRGEAIQEIRDIEAQLYSMMEGMFEQTAGGKLSKRQAEGYRLIERGLLFEARQVLDFDAIVSESRHDEEVIAQAANRAQVHIKEQMQLKDVNAALLDWDGVDACYREALRLEEKHNLPRNSMLLYVEYLYLQSRRNEAVELGEKLLRYYEVPESAPTDEDKSFILNLLGIIYMDSNRMADAEAALKESLEIRKSRTAVDPIFNEAEIAVVYNGIGNLFYLQLRYDEAEEAHKSALEIRKKQAAHNPDRYMANLGHTYINLGAVYDDMDKYAQSAELMISAKDIFKKLAVSKPEPNEEYYAHCCCNLGSAYAHLQRFEEAEGEIRAALEILVRLAERNPGAYEWRVAETAVSLGELLLETKRYEESREAYNTALDIYKRLSSREPEAFEPKLAEAYKGLGELDIETQRYPEAESALNAAIRLYEKYEDSNPAFKDLAAEARAGLAGLTDLQGGSGKDSSLLTAKEKEVALLLTEGETQREIARRLHMSAADVALCVRAIREKVVSMADADPVVAAVVHEYKLTRREADMLRFLRRNAATDEIASELYLSEETVRKHVRSLLEKLSIDDRKNVAGWLERYGKPGV